MEIVEYLFEIEGKYSSINSRLRSLNESMQGLMGKNFSVDARCVLFVERMWFTDYIGEDKIEEIKKGLVDILSDSKDFPGMDPKIVNVRWSKHRIQDVFKEMEDQKQVDELVSAIEEQGKDEALLIHRTLVPFKIELDFSNL